MKLSKDQEQALNEVYRWLKNLKKPFLTLGGYAGTGKTTLISVLRKRLHQAHPKLKVGFVSFTGKAARVLSDTLKQSKSVYKQDTVSTIHSLIYSPIINSKKEIVDWELKDKIDRQLIIVDEASMVNQEIWQHLSSYQVPILAVGDHGQLPPIEGKFNLMADPDLVLETIYRQAKTNPIIDVSIQARKFGRIEPHHYSSQVIKYHTQEPESQNTLEQLLKSYNQDTLVLCGYNHTRQKLNQFIRQSLGFNSPEPTRGDRVICLRNNHEKNIYNGMLGTLVKIKSKNADWYQAEIEIDGNQDLYSGLISKKQFTSPESLNFSEKRRLIMKGDLFDFGYALTVHKAQGGQAERVILLEERFKQMTDLDWRRWLYTGVTRAQQQLYVFGEA